MKILYLIPARSGSKGIIDKNIKLLNGIPLLAWSIKQAIGSSRTQTQMGHQCRIVVSTDSHDYARISRSYGAETPFIRPKQISEDHSTDYEFMTHTISNLTDWVPDIIVHLRPTQPCRKISLINDTIFTFITHFSNYSSLRTVSLLKKSPFKSYIISDNMLVPLFKNYQSIQEPYNQGRQTLPQTYIHNGYIDITKTVTIQKYNSISGPSIYPYILKDEDFIDIDSLEDFQKATYKLNHPT